MTVEHPPCPTCGAPTDWEFDCPGYERSTYYALCMPACGHAIKHWCPACGWWLKVPENVPPPFWTEPGPAPNWDVFYPFDLHTES